jgi:hypothetical protein
MTFIKSKNGESKRVCLLTGEKLLITRGADGVINTKSTFIEVESIYDNSRYDKPYESR